MVREDGLIVTALHLVQDATGIIVGFSDGSEAQARLLGENLGLDVAVLKVPRSGLSPITIADGANLRVGQAVSKLGYPSGYLELSTGIISALVEPSRIDGALIQITADINPGDSGAPVITAVGELAGIVISKHFDLSGVSFASPLDDQMIGRLANGERICQPMPPPLDASTFAHPNGWFVDVPPGVEYDETFTADVPAYHLLSREAPYPWVEVSIEELPFSYSSVDELLYLSSFEGWTYTPYTSVRPICHQNGLDAWEIDYEVEDEEGYFYYERDLVIRKGRSWYLLVGLGPYDGFVDVEQEIDTILYSFRFER